MCIVYLPPSYRIVGPASPSGLEGPEGGCDMKIRWVRNHPKMYYIKKCKKITWKKIWDRLNSKWTGWEKNCYCWRTKPFHHHYSNRHCLELLGWINSTWFDKARIKETRRFRACCCLLTEAQVEWAVDIYARNPVPSKGLFLEYQGWQPILKQRES